MSADRTEAAGFGIALVGHAALFAALYYLVNPRPDAPDAPAPASMEVSFVEESGLISSAPSSEPAAASFSPETGAPDEAAPAATEQPVPEPTPRPLPSQPQPRPSPSPPQQRAAQPQPAERQQQRANPEAGAARGQANRGSRLGPDFLKGLGNDPAARSQRASGAVMSNQAIADIGALISRQVQPCANRQRYPGPGAERIRVTIRLRINPNGSLAAAPTIVNHEGVDDSNRRYLALVEENTINSFTQCAPLRGLPAELYDVPRGWRDFRLRYRLPGRG